MDCMEYMDQVVGNISGNFFEGFQKRDLKTDVTFKKMSVGLFFLCGKRVNGGKVGNGGVVGGGREKINSIMNYRCVLFK